MIEYEQKIDGEWQYIGESKDLIPGFEVREYGEPTINNLLESAKKKLGVDGTTE